MVEICLKEKNVVKSDEIIKSSETIYPHLLKFNSSKKRKNLNVLDGAFIMQSQK